MGTEGRQERKPADRAPGAGDWWDEVPGQADGPQTAPSGATRTSSVADEALLWVLFVGLLVTGQLVTFLIADRLRQPWSSLAIVVGETVALLPLAIWRVRASRRSRGPVPGGRQR